MSLSMRWADISGLKQFERAIDALEPRQVRKVGALALNRAGSQGLTRSRRALSKQTGLPQKLLKGHMRPHRATPATLAYLIRASGGDIGLKYFGARETRSGVSAMPFGKRQVFAGTFIKGGRFPGRVALKMGGHVFARDGKARLGIGKRRSGVIVPSEMVRDESARAWTTTISRVLPGRFAHELGRLTKGVFK